MLQIFSKYANWLHLQWPAGTVERLPTVREHGRSNIPGLYIVGDLSGIPLLKMSLESGVDALRDAQTLLPEREGDIDVCIIGGGISGVAAAIEAKKLGLTYTLLESNQLFSTINNFPKKKPIFTYPTDMTPSSDLQVSADVKEDLLQELTEQVEKYGIEQRAAFASHVQRDGRSLLVMLKDAEPIRAKTVLVAIGRSGNYRRMNVPGEDLDKVSNRLIDPAKHIGQDIAIIGGGDSACEAAIAIADLNSNDQDQALVSLVYRGAELSRPKPENVKKVMDLAQAGKIQVHLGSSPRAIADDSITLSRKGGEDGEHSVLKNDQVLALIGREAPLDFFRRSGVRIYGEYPWWKIAAYAAFLLFATLVYGMKAGVYPMSLLANTWFNPGTLIAGLADSFNDPTTLIGTTLQSARTPSFWVTVAYSATVFIFGIKRIRRRKTPYVTLQTMTLMCIQIIPLFILPEIILPWIDSNGWMSASIKDNLFPGGSYWHAYGFILAWPLMIWNVFTDDPMIWWLIISCVQTFVIIPFIVWRWGKGAYCGWVCSCGALAETLGDTHREKMPHGKKWNRLNFIGQGLLLISIILLIAHIIHWIYPPFGNSTVTHADGSSSTHFWLGAWFVSGFWKIAVDYILAGALGTGLYFWLSGRVWCRFSCPLSALMHIYSRMFSRFRIIADSSKCISCNGCTATCHQGIDVMNFANKGLHMSDPECVRCSACVQVCPTGVLQFGQVDSDGVTVVNLDTLAASPIHMRENSCKSA